MSRRDQKYRWRHVRCGGCERACRYRSFRPDPSVPSFAEVHAVMRDNPRYPFHRRGTVLGFMHEWKRKLWEEHCECCPESLEVYQLRGRDPDPDGGCPF